MQPKVKGKQQRMSLIKLLTLPSNCQAFAAKAPVRTANPYQNLLANNQDRHMSISMQIYTDLLTLETSGKD